MEDLLCIMCICKWKTFYALCPYMEDFLCILCRVIFSGWPRRYIIYMIIITIFVVHSSVKCITPSVVMFWTTLAGSM